MQIIKNILAGFGVIFLIIILIIVILVVVKPYGVDVIRITSVLLDKNPTSSYDHPYLSVQQEAILESVGIDTKKLPTEITPALQKCATPILGQARATEIMSGDIPTVEEMLKIKDCFQ